MILKRLGAALSLAALVILPATGLAIPLHRTPRVLTEPDGMLPHPGFQWRPFHIIFAIDGAALLAGRGRVSNHMRWTTWNRKEGRAWGAEWHDNCIPDCVSGTYFAYPVNVRVYRPGRVDGYLLFTRMTVTYKRAVPPYPAYRRTMKYKVRYDIRYDDFFWASGSRRSCEVLGFALRRAPLVDAKESP